MMKISYEVNESITIKDFIYKTISRNFYGYLKELSAVFLVNGVEKPSHYLLNIHDKLEIIYEVNEKKDGIYSYGELRVIWEDASFIVLDKQPHLLTIPSKNEPDDSLYNRLLAYFKNTTNSVHIVNRLDKETKGLVLVAKNKLARALLGDVDKLYVAKTSSRLPLNEGTISDAISKSEEGIKRQVDLLKGVPAITHYKLVKEENGVFTYHIKLETGRTHQIRVHFSYYKAPILGDSLYGGEPTSDDVMQLTCQKISYIDPFTKEKREFVSNYR